MSMGELSPGKPETIAPSTVPVASVPSRHPLADFLGWVRRRITAQHF